MRRPRTTTSASTGCRGSPATTAPTRRPSTCSTARSRATSCSDRNFAEWAEPATRPAFEAAIAVLKATGMQFVETKLPDLPYGAALATILAGEMGSIFEPLITSGKVDELADKPQIAGLKASLELPAKDYLRAMRLRRLMQEAVGRVFGSVDVLLAPGRAGIASKLDQPLDRGAGGPPPKDPGFRAIIPMGNLAGL